MTEKISLAKQSVYPLGYDPGLLSPILRSEARTTLFTEVSPPAPSLPFHGADHWTAYELSWLNRKGKPVCAIAEFTFPCDSHSIVESKSFKYYLSSFNQSNFVNADHVRQTLGYDLSRCVGAAVEVNLRRPEDLFDIGLIDGICIDDCELVDPVYTPNPDLLSVQSGKKVSEVLYSHLLKTNCPVTGQPDWGSIWICYNGSKITNASLLAYIVSFRMHQGFHENCVERIFVELLQYCQPQELSVYARYTRRGGLDINPFRTNCGMTPPNIRVPRQ